MRYINSMRMILIGLILISTSGCKLNWSNDSDASLSTSIKTNVVEQPYEVVNLPPILEEELLFVPEGGDEQPNNDCNPIPEPITILLLGPGLFGLLLARRKKKEKLSS